MGGTHHTQTNQLPQTPGAGKCRRLAGPLTRRSERRSMAHTAKMEAKRVLRRIQQPGFQPVPNKRVDAAIKGEFAALMIAAAERQALGGSAPDVQKLQYEAIRAVCRSLPRPPMVFDWRNGLPTKNDNASYRKN